MCPFDCSVFFSWSDAQSFLFLCLLHGLHRSLVIILVTIINEMHAHMPLYFWQLKKKATDNLYWVTQQCWSVDADCRVSITLKGCLKTHPPLRDYACMELCGRRPLKRTPTDRLCRLTQPCRSVCQLGLASLVATWQNKWNVTNENTSFLSCIFMERSMAVNYLCSKTSSITIAERLEAHEFYIFFHCPV